ncbi:uncharacterized protein LODBEIA_P04710 [Lodderomyces beijingensis]|uniref:PUM-HD domain-containing protein n=1 Tax=Lodderomyces beijingensis TaxID=1775926 RepID=A0ABP0ZFN1_9ASCO
MGNKSKGVKRPAITLTPEEKKLKKAKYNNNKKKLPSPPSEDEVDGENESDSEELPMSEDEELEDGPLGDGDEEDELDELDELDEENGEKEKDEEGDEDDEDDNDDDVVVEDSPQTAEDPNKKSSKEQHSEQKKLLGERKLQRKSGVQVQDIKKLWEKLRVTKPTPTKQQRDKLCDEIWALSENVINDLVLKHDASRVVQTLVKYSSKERRDKIVDSLKGSFYQLATSAYGKYLLIKLLHYGSKESRGAIVNELHGKLRKLMRHREGAYVVEDLFVLYSTAEQKQQMIREFWGSEYAVFKESGKGKTVLDVVKESSEKKQLIMQNLFGTIKASVEKGSTGFQILHAAMKEYVTVLADDIDANDSAIRDFIDLLSEQFAELVHTQEGSEVASSLIAMANAKERKGIIKSLKSHQSELIKNEYGNAVLIALLMAVDDTVLTYRSFFGGGEMFTAELLPEIIQDKFSRRPILYILKGLDGRYFAPNVKKAFSKYQDLAYQKTSKKDKDAKRAELLAKSIEPIYKALQPSLEDAQFTELLSNNMAAQFITELLLTPTSNEKVNSTYRPQMLQAVFDKVFKGDVREDHHLLNKAPFTSRSIKALIQGNNYKFDNESKKLVHVEGSEKIPDTGIAFAEKAADEIVNKVSSWTSGQPAFVLLSLLEVLTLAKSEKAETLKKELKKNKKSLSAEDKGSKLLLDFL